MVDPMLVTEGATKSYGDLVALAPLDLAIESHAPLVAMRVFSLFLKLLQFFRRE